MIREPSMLPDLIQLYAAYASCVDGERFDDWPSFFTEDCVYRIVARENYEAGYPLSIMALNGVGGLRDRVYGVTSTLFHAPYYQRHVIGLPLIKGHDSDIILTEANYQVVRTKRDMPSELFNVGRYIDRIVRTSDGLKFAEKLCVFDSELIPNSIIYPI